MSIELAEKLKAKLTDKWVVVDGSAPELRRFANWTGKVKTVNMNCRALVEFDGPVDIGWYDIDPAFLTIVDGPRPKEVKEAKAKTAAPAAEAKQPAAAKPAGMSPLEAARAQGAPKPAVAAAPAAATPATGKSSPLDMIRKQGAAKPAGTAAPATPAAPPPAATPVAEAAPAPVVEPAPPVVEPAAKPAAAPTTAPDGRKLSPLELIRMQGAAKRPS